MIRLNKIRYPYRWLLLLLFFPLFSSATNCKKTTSFLTRSLCRSPELRQQQEQTENRWQHLNQLVSDDITDPLSMRVINQLKNRLSHTLHNCNSTTCLVENYQLQQVIGDYLVKIDALLPSLLPTQQPTNISCLAGSYSFSKTLLLDHSTYLRQPIEFKKKYNSGQSYTSIQIDSDIEKDGKIKISGETKLHYGENVYPFEIIGQFVTPYQAIGESNSHYGHNKIVLSCLPGKKMHLSLFATEGSPYLFNALLAPTEQEQPPSTAQEHELNDYERAKKKR